jgi:DNA-binding transcriptional regulator YiaG
MTSKFSKLVQIENCCADAVEGISGVTWAQHAWPFEEKMTRQEIYRLRDRSGLTRQEFYRRYFDQPSAKIEKLEVGKSSRLD